MLITGRIYEDANIVTVMSLKRLYVTIYVDLLCINHCILGDVTWRFNMFGAAGCWSLSAALTEANDANVSLV